MVKKKEMYSCEVCGKPYDSEDMAQLCEEEGRKQEITPFKYKIGETVRIKLERNIGLKPVVIDGEIKERMIKPTVLLDHKNVYLVKFVDTSGGYFSPGSKFVIEEDIENIPS